jgi:hypothetical protein
VASDVWEHYGWGLTENEIDGDSVVVHFDTLKASTPEAVLIGIESRETWVPRSKIIDMNRNSDSPFDKSGSLEIPDWLSEAKDL